jgi:hypothetical protein
VEHQVEGGVAQAGFSGIFDSVDILVDPELTADFAGPGGCRGGGETEGEQESESWGCKLGKEGSG